MLNTKLGRDTGNQENHSETRINYTRDDTSCSSETRRDGCSLMSAVEQCALDISEFVQNTVKIEVNIGLGI